MAEAAAEESAAARAGGDGALCSGRTGQSGAQRSDRAAEYGLDRAGRPNGGVDGGPAGRRPGTALGVAGREGPTDIGFEGRRTVLERLRARLPDGAKMLLLADRFYPSAALFARLGGRAGVTGCG
jgi:hypothetical protein